MGYLTLALGAFLSLLGLYSYFSTGMEHLTALIPTGFGVVFLLLGWLSQNPKLRMHIMHGSAALSLIGLVMTGPSALSATGQYFAGAEVYRPDAAFAKFLMAAACLAYLVVCIQSFVEARREREAQQEREANEKKSKSRSRMR
jgi:hypothetical protein